MSDEREVIDVDDADVGARNCVRIDRPPSPRLRKRARDPVIISLVDSDSDDPLTPPQLKS